MSVAITNMEIPLLLQKHFGGSIGTYDYNPDKHKPFTKWQIGGQRVADACELLLPFLRIKRPQAELAILFQRERFVVNPRRNGLTQEEVVARRGVMATMKQMNRRGPEVI